MGSVLIWGCSGSRRISGEYPCPHVDAVGCDLRSGAGRDGPRLTQVSLTGSSGLITKLRRAAVHRDFSYRSVYALDVLNRVWPTSRKAGVVGTFATLRAPAWYQNRILSRLDSGPEYRRRKVDLRQLLGEAERIHSYPGGAAVADILAIRRPVIAGVRQRLGELQAAGELTRTSSELCASFVHMSCNRLSGPGWPTQMLALGLLMRTRTALDHGPAPR